MLWSFPFTSVYCNKNHLRLHWQWVVWLTATSLITNLMFVFASASWITALCSVSTTSASLAAMSRLSASAKFTSILSGRSWPMGEEHIFSYIHTFLSIFNPRFLLIFKAMLIFSFKLEILKSCSSLSCRFAICCFHSPKRKKERKLSDI